jgi:hypothetical protein
LLKDVYVTDHTPKDKKFFTTSKDEDEEFYRYKKSLAQYNADVKLAKTKKEFKYERGSLLQKIMDPLAGAERLENGAVFIKVEDIDLDPNVHSDNALRKEFERLTNNADETIDTEEEDEIRRAILD